MYQSSGFFLALGLAALFALANRGPTVKSTPDLLTAFGNPQAIPTDVNGVFQFDDTSVSTSTAQFYQLTFP